MPCHNAVYNGVTAECINFSTMHFNMLRYCKSDERTLNFHPESFGLSLVHLLFEIGSMVGQKNTDTGYLNPDYKLPI
jgi:hypothetical protein